MLTLFQKIVGVFPFLFILLAISVLSITQSIWKKRNYLIYVFCFSCYSLFSLWAFKFDVSAFGFQVSSFPFIYLGYCFLFEKIFLKLKYERIQRTFPIYVMFIDGDDIWSKKFNEGPQSADRVVSAGLVLATVFTILGLIIFIR